MMCDRCQKPMTAEESEAYEMPGATGPGLTIRVHRRPCSLPVAARPTPYPRERKH